MPVPKVDLPGLKSEVNRRHLSVYTAVGMTFWPHDKVPIAPYRDRGIDPIDVTWDSKKTQGALKSFQWQKTLGEASGKWTAVIKDNNPFRMDFEKGEVLPDDWCDIYINRNGVVIPICRGYVDTVRRNKIAAGGATVKTWTVAGRDHAGFYEFPIAFTNYYIRTIGEIVQGLFTEKVRGKIGGSPDELFELLIQATFGRGTKSSIRLLPKALDYQEGERSDLEQKGLLDILEITKTATKGKYLNELQLWHNPGENLDQTLTNWCNPLFNEFIHDLQIDANYPTTGTAASKIESLIRERPFVILDDYNNSGSTRYGINSPWFDTTTWTLPSWLIDTDSIGISGNDRFNLISLLADVGLASEHEQLAQSPPAWDKEGMKRHGLRLYQKSTRFIQDASKGIGEWPKDRKLWQDMLVDWYCLNPFFWNGSITFNVALPEIRIGHRLKIDSGNPNEIWTFYVEGVTINYEVGDSPSAPPSSSTTFMVTRGWKGSDKSLVQAVSDASKQFTQDYI